MRNLVITLKNFFIHPIIKPPKLSKIRIFISLGKTFSLFLSFKTTG